MKLDPTLLQHPNIPKPLHGINPRMIMGKSWWDVERKKVYAAQNFRCAACGVHKRNAKYHQWLEAHERYEIDYIAGSVKFINLVALCHCCHNFVHSGRLKMLLAADKITRDKLITVLRHGFGILKQHNLTPYWGTAHVWLTVVLGKSSDEAEQILSEKGFFDNQETMLLAPWHKHYLDFHNKRYYTPYESFDAWRKHYASDNPPQAVPRVKPFDDEYMHAKRDVNRFKATALGKLLARVPDLDRYDFFGNGPH